MTEDRDARRAALRARRKARSGAELDAAGRAIAARALALPELAAARVVGVYRSVRAEVPTEPLFAALGDRAASPAVLPDRGMTFRLGSALRSGALGIPEPAGPEVRPDVLVVPGLAFDAAGHRLGQGGGYYDRYLAARESAGDRPFCVAVCVDEDLVPFVPTLPHDRDVDAVVTPSRTIRARRPLRVTAAVWIRDGRLFAARRPAGKARGGCWELPGGKVEPGESDPTSLARELAEELGIEARVEPHPVARAIHAYPDVTVDLVALRIHAAGAPAPAEHDAVRWLLADELGEVPWAPADLPLLPAIRPLLA